MGKMKEHRQNRVLIVDANPDIAQLIRIVIEKSGNESLSVNTIGEAVGLVEEQQFDLLICDVGLNDGSCDELVDTAHKRNPHMDVIVFIDGYRYSLSPRLREDYCFPVERFNFKQLDEVVKVLFADPFTEGKP